MNAASQSLPSPAPSQSASALLRSSRRAARFSSNCPALDALLSPASSGKRVGLAQGSVLEIMGTPGIGKTKMALGFVISARFEAITEETDCEVLVIDTEGSMSPELIYDTASLYANHNSHPPYAAREVCEGIHYERICDSSLLVAFLHSLPAWLADHSATKLVVIDSLTTYLRPTALDISTRKMILSLIASTLSLLTSVNSISVIATTQLSLKLFSPETGLPSGFTRDAESLLVPGLGVAWIGGPSWRIALYFDSDGGRMAHLVSSHVPSRAKEAAFTMDALGPCDIPE